MANRLRGEFPLVAGDTTYTLVLDTDAMIALEEHFSTPEQEVFFADIFSKVNRGSVKHARAFIWAALRRHHPAVTLEDTNDIIQAAGGYFGMQQQLLQSLAETTVPAETDLQTLGVNARPRKAQGTRERTRRQRTGTGSTGTRGASA